MLNTCCYGQATMCQKVIFLVTCVAMIYGSEARQCVSPQYARYNEKVILDCDIQRDVKGVYWYESAEREDPFIKYENNEITGKGYNSGEYNMLSSGALVINNVTWEHDVVFKLLVLDNLLSLDTSFIRIEVIVEPDQVAPSIDGCEGSTYCSLYVKDYESLQCIVQGARPSVHLQWFLIHADKENILDSYCFNSSTGEGIFDSSSSFTLNQTVMSVLPAVLICRASGPALALSSKPSQTTVLLESSQRYDAVELPEKTAEEVYFEDKNPAKFPCQAVSDDSLVIWRAGTSKHALQTLGYSFRGSDVNVADENVVISGDGTLRLHNISMSHEGIFVCFDKKIDLTFVVAYRLVVLVRPSPLFPVISDCSGWTCNRTVASEGTLSCTVYNIHPEVDLFLLTESIGTRLGNQSQQNTVDEESKLSTVSVQATYSIVETPCEEYVLITCQASGPAVEVFNSTAQINISKRDCNIVADSTSNMTVIWIVVPVALLTVIGCGWILFYIMLSKGNKIAQPSIMKWQTRGYVEQFLLTEEDVRIFQDEDNLQRLCKMYEMKKEHERQIKERKEDPATAFLEVLFNHYSLSSVENVEKIKSIEKLSKSNERKPFGGCPESITSFSLQGWKVDDITSVSSSDVAVTYHCPEKTCSMILIGNKNQIIWSKHFKSSRVNAHRFICALEDNKLVSCCESKVIKLEPERSGDSSNMTETEYDLQERMENSAQGLWGISYNRSLKKVGIGVENDNKIFLFDGEMNFLKEFRVETTTYWPQCFALTSYVGNEYVTLCTWPQNNVMSYNLRTKSCKDFNQIEGTLWAKHICCGTDGLVYVLFSKTSKCGDKPLYILQHKVDEVNPKAKLENLQEDTCVITYADLGKGDVILTMDQNGNLEEYDLPPTDEKAWKESKWKRLSSNKDTEPPPVKEEEESLLPTKYKEDEV